MLRSFELEVLRQIRYDESVAHDPDVYYNPEAEPFVIADAEIVAVNLSASSNRGKPRNNGCRKCWIILRISHAYRAHVCGTRETFAK